MSPLVPGCSCDERLICGLVEVGELRVTSLDEDDPKLLNPDTQREIQLALGGWGKRSVPG
jgi:hypothetical protein